MSTGASSLSLLFPALGAAGFRERHWPARPARCHGDPARLGELGELGELGALALLVTRARVLLKAMLPGPGGRCTELAIQPSEMLSLCGAGATIACGEMERWHPAAAALLHGLCRDLGLPDSVGGCNLYLSPPGRGVPAHFDDHEIIVVQLSGRKRWSVARNTVVRNPLRNATLALEGDVARYADGPQQPAPALRRVSLRPGSVLFLPRGYWHATDARDLSISLTFGLRAPSWLELLQERLAADLVLQAAWREPAWELFGDPARRARAGERWAALRAGLLSILEALPVESLPAAPAPPPSGAPAPAVTEPGGARTAGRGPGRQRR